MDNFPALIIQEILCRLSVKDLLKFRTVCSEWRSVIDNEYFKKKHFEEAKLNPNASSIIIVKAAALNHLESTLHFWYPNNNLHSQIPFNLSQFLERDNNNNPAAAAELMARVPCCLNVNNFMFRKLGTVNGLVILGWDILYVIWNPSINQHKTFQGPPLTIQYFRHLMNYGRSRRRTNNNRADNCHIRGFGYAPISQDYKFVIATFSYFYASFRPDIKTRVVFHMYSLRNNSWIRRSFLTFPISVAGLVNGDGYTEDGKFYWFAMRCGDNGTPALIVFDFNTERFDWVPLPQELDVVHEAVAVGNYKDLNILTTFIDDGHEDDLRCEVWWMQKHEDGSSSWSRKCTLETPCEVGRPIGLVKGSGQMIFESFIVPQDYNKQLLLLNPRTQFGINLGYLYTAPEILVFNFVKSLFSVNLLPINEGQL